MSDWCEKCGDYHSLLGNPHRAANVDMKFEKLPCNIEKEKDLLNENVMNVFVVMKCLYPGEELIAIEKTKNSAIKKCTTMNHFWAEAKLGKSIKKQINDENLKRENWPKRF